jgi:hypothetical protein
MLLFPIATWAAKANSVSTGSAKTMELGLGINATQFRYDEELDSPLKSSEQSTFGSLLLQAKVFLPEGFYLKGRYEAIGNVDSQYDGTTQSGAPVLSTDKLSFTTMEIDLYVPIFPDLYVFAGLGSRKWDRLLVGGSTYREIYSWNFMPLGVAWNFWKSGPISYGTEFSWRMMSAGKIKIITSEHISGGQDSEINLGNKSGYKLAFPVRVQADPRFSLEFVPWYEHSEIGQSSVVPNATLAPTPGTGIMEPASKTEQYGVEAMLQILL